MSSPPMPILLLCAVVAANTVSLAAFPALIPEVARTADLSDAQVGVLAGAHGFARMCADLPIGLMATRRLGASLALGPLLLSAGVLGVSFAGSFPALVAARAVMGAAHAVTMVTILTLILRYRRGAVVASSLNAVEFFAMSAMVAANAALALVPSTLPWSTAFLLVCAPQFLGLLLLIPLVRSLPANGATVVEPRVAPPPPGDPPRLGTRAVVAAALAAGFVVALSYSMLEQFLIPLRGSREFGLTRAGVAGLLALVQAADLVALMPVGFLGDRHGARGVLGRVLVLQSAGVLLVSFGGLPLMVAGCALFGVSMAGWMLPLGVLRAHTPAPAIAWRTGVYRVAVDAGLFVGPFVSGLLSAGPHGLLPAVVAAGLVVLGIRLLRR